MNRNSKDAPPPALAGCRVEQYAIRPRTVKYSGHSWLFVEGKELGPVPRMAICREKSGLNLFYCDRRWNVLGCSGTHATIRAAKARAERAYPGISKWWIKTGYTAAQVKKFFDDTGYYVRCSFCGASQFDVQSLVTSKKRSVAICDRCIHRINELMTERPDDATSDPIAKTD